MMKTPGRQQEIDLHLKMKMWEGGNLEVSMKGRDTEDRRRVSQTALSSGNNYLFLLNP
jgi:hypothetical protein